MKIIWHGHAFIEIQTQGQQILIDPFIDGNPFTKTTAADYSPDYILLTHAHHDHVGSTAEIAERSGATIVAIADLATYFAQQCFQTEGPNIGGTVHLPFGDVKLTPAWHTSATEVNGINLPLGVATGMALKIEDKLLYISGDTGLFSDMQLVARKQPVDVAFLPIGDHFTMGSDDAAYAASLVHAKTVVPIHYNTFPAIQADPEEFLEMLAPGQGKIPVVDQAWTV
ncbi:MAG TPA: metal-dependent hydrolase [Candidatus Ligilactobacillus excrementipullorum]|nr:metal-dependent hydrolase [Candidatus Ligilactobacillus excrementipullorum]